MTSKAATIPQCIIIYSENYTKCVDTLTPKELEYRLPRAVLSMRIKVPGVVLNTSSGWNQPGRKQSVISTLGGSSVSPLSPSFKDHFMSPGVCK